MKILIIRFTSVRQILFSTPVIRVLKTELDAEVHFATQSKHEDLLANNPYLDQIHVNYGDLKQFSKNLKSENFDLIIDLENDLKSKRLKLMLGKKAYSINNLSFRKWIFINFKINLLPNLHVVDRFLKVIEPLNVSGDNLGLDYFISERDDVENSWLPETHQSGYAAVCLSAKHRTRQLPENRIIELCDRINKPIILIGEKKDIEIAKKVETFFKHGTESQEKEIEELNKKAVIFNACGKFNFNQSASIVKRASWVFTYDNDMMHIAAAFKKQIFSIWGNTSSRFGEYPYRTQFTIFENNKLNCRPCSKGGFNKCPKGHFKCMNELTFDFYLPD